MKLIVFDGNSILNRAFYGIRPLTTASGLPTNAVYGFVNIIEKNIASVLPDFAAIAFDMRAKTFRHLAVETYKANRHGMPDELAVQLPYAKKAAEGLGIKVVECEGYEADDIIGTLAAASESLGGECVIVTGDRDSFQLVSDRTTVYLTATNETKIIDTAAVKEKYGLSPRSLIDVKALMGDSSDNILGVPGIGEKSAVKLISEYGTLDGVYAAVDSMTGSIKQKLISGRDSAYQSRFLAEIKLDVPVDTDLSHYKYTGKNADILIPLFTELEFSGIIERMGLKKSAADVMPAEFKRASAGEIAGLNPLFADIRGSEAYFTDGKSYLFCPAEEAADLFKRNDLSVAVWSSKDAMHALDGMGISFDNCAEDLSLMSYLLTPSDSGISLQKTAMTWLSAESVTEPLAVLPQLFNIMSTELGKRGQTGLYRDIELPLAKVLFRMEKRGFAVDVAGITAYGKALGEKAKECEDSIYMLAGEEFNINSPKQLGHILFEVLKLPAGKKTKSGYSTDAETLEKLRDDSPIIDLILFYRTLTKLKGTYTDGLTAVADPSDGRVHTTFRQTLTQTGRLSSVEPNLQNIPVRTSVGREMRRFFIAKDGYLLVDADYSQIELRILAALSGDENMIAAFLSGADIHTATASKVFGVPEEQVTPDLRKRAKAVNFGTVYGISAFSLAGDIGVSRKTAERYINDYFDKYPGVRRFLDTCVENAGRDGYVTTLFGRRRYIPELRSPKASVRAFGERVAMNTPIQGTAADIIKKAMVDTERALESSGIDARLILQIHDELIVEAKAEHAERAKDILVGCMEHAFEAAVPLIADAHIGKSWYEAKGE